MPVKTSYKLLAGLILISIVFLVEVLSSWGTVGTVAYILIALYIFWVGDTKKNMIAVGLVTSAFLIIGFINSPLSEAAFGITADRILAFPAIWLGVYCAIRFKESSEKERRQKEQLTAIFDNATEGIFFIKEDGEIIKVNRIAERMFGYCPDELIGSRIDLLIPQRYLQKHLAFFKDYTQKPKDRNIENDVLARHKKGTYFPVKINLSHSYRNNELFVIAFVLDITQEKKASSELKKLNEKLEERVKDRTQELFDALHKLEKKNADLENEINNRKKIEQELEKSQHLYKVVADNFPDGIVGILNKDFKYVFADGKDLERLGLSDNRGVGKFIFDDLHPEANVYANELLIQTFKGEKISFEVDLGCRVYNVNAVPLVRDNESNIDEILVVIRNVTEMKAMESDLIKALNKEKEVSVLKSRFVTLASHEFRTPLSTILSSVFLLENYTGVDYELKKQDHLRKIKRSVNNMTELLNDLLSVGKLEEGRIKVQHEEIDIHKLLEELLSEMDLIKKAGQKIELELKGEENLLIMDKQLLSSIIRNLLSNAFKYSPPDTPVEVKIEITKDKFRIKVRDYGIGIPENERHNIFKRFFRAHNAMNIKGTGLGLNIIKKYIKLLNGKIQFSSVINEGTVFIVEIPVPNNISEMYYEPQNFIDRR